MRNIKFLFAGILLFTLSLVTMAVTIAENGKTDYVIVRPDSCPGILQKELGHFAGTLQQATGAKFRIVQEKNLKNFDKVISFGNTRAAVANGLDDAAMSREMFAVKRVGNNIFINGKDDIAKVFALYEFLQEFVRCRYFDQANVVIPKLNKLSVPEVDIRRAPSFTLRRIFSGNSNRESFYETAFALKKTYNPRKNSL